MTVNNVPVMSTPKIAEEATNSILNENRRPDGTCANIEDLNATNDVQECTKRTTNCCTGVIPFKKSKMNEYLDYVFMGACSDHPNSLYKFKMAGDSPQDNILHKNCTGIRIPHSSKKVEAYTVSHATLFRKQRAETQTND